MTRSIPLAALVLVACAGSQAPLDEVVPGGRFLTSRDSPVELALPVEREAFTFVVFGDRTGGPAEGIDVLEQAVADTNLIGPDLVMTVGDLVQGYNTHEPWLEQTREFKGVMDRLDMPWFPVAGNHDVYWRGPGRPAEEHEGNYEVHFGPLWYAFRHKRCWFVVLYTDEPNPVTGERNFNKPECQRMSPEQLAWLERTLARTRERDQVFVFLHHPRWLSRYGDDWRNVHRVLAARGNVRAVFAGHIHQMRFDGERDGIEYFALATVGGVQWGKVPEAGYLHELHVVTVRHDSLDVVALPVGAAMDPRAITGELSEEVREFDQEFAPEITGKIVFDDDFRAETRIVVTVTNPIERPVDVTLLPDSRDRRWVFVPDHVHRTVEPGSRVELELVAVHPGDGLDGAIDGVSLSLCPEYLGTALRFPLPVRTLVPEVVLPASATPIETDAVLSLDGIDDHLSVDHTIPRVGRMTCELWLSADDNEGARTVLHGAGWRLRLLDGVPELTVGSGGGRVRLTADGFRVEPGTWHHIAGVVDGRVVRLFVDGERVAVGERRSAQEVRPLPVQIGAVRDGDAPLREPFAGRIDEVRIAAGARYTSEGFVPERRRGPDERGVLLLHMDRAVGPWMFDGSGAGHHAVRHGGVDVQ